jgi:hypothetical protein
MHSRGWPPGSRRAAFKGEQTPKDICSIDMSRYAYILCLCILYQLPGFAQTIYTARDGTISFFSSAPLEDISAENNRVQARLNSETGEIMVRLRIEDFNFRVGLMQRHFNERFMESHIYPEARFSGMIENFSEFTGQESDHKVNGSLTIHGVTRDIEIDINLRESGPDLTGNTSFQIRVADYGIRIPRIFIRNIAEVVDVTVVLRLSPEN